MSQERKWRVLKKRHLILTSGLHRYLRACAHKQEHTKHTQRANKQKELNIRSEMHTIIYGKFHSPFPVKLICKEIFLWAKIPEDLHLMDAHRIGLTGMSALSRESSRVLG